jgi:hypothetical protein
VVLKKVAGLLEEHHKLLTQGSNSQISEKAQIELKERKQSKVS